MLDIDIRVWPKACKHCGGDLHFYEDFYEKQLTCWQCGRSPDPVTQERLVDWGPARPGKRAVTY